jgi:pyrimidine-specific ribonucleoside hydrolase
MTSRVPLIIDCDPGHDDMMALMVALSDPRAGLHGITTVAGNQTGEKTFLNTLKILTLLGAETVAVARGADAPMMRDLVVAPAIHGVSGLDGADLPEPGVTPSDMTALELLSQILMNVREPIVLVPTGPLTNIAVFLLARPDLAPRIRRIVLMGGAVHDSNVTPAAEFNIFVDPEAARVVFRSGVPITMIGLDVTNKAVLSFDDIAAIKNMNGPISSVVGPLLEFFARANNENFGIQGAPIHDALAVMAAIEPEIVETRSVHVAIETASELCRGQTVTDLYGVTGRLPNAEVALNLNLDLFKENLFQTLRRLDAV